MERIERIGFISVLVLILYGILLSAAQSFSMPIVIKFAHTSGGHTPVAQGANLFKKLAEDRLTGKVVIEVYGASQLGNAEQIMDGVQKGGVEIAVLPLSRFIKFSREFQVFELPFLFEDLGAVTRFQDSATGEKLLAAMQKENFKGLAFWHHGMTQLAANRAIRLPSDAKDLRLRLPRSDVMAQYAKVLGAKDVWLPFGDVYAALQQGRLDGVESTWTNIYALKPYEAPKYVSVTDQGYLGYLLVSNRDFWNKPPYDIKAELNGIVREVTKAVNKLAVEDSYQAAQKIAQSGLTNVLLLRNDERQQWRQTMEPVWREFEKEIGKDIIAAAVKAGTGGGGQPCPLGTCRCPDRTCKKECCY
jgi:C4-dicarboxylate-binding protein DctP